MPSTCVTGASPSDSASSNASSTPLIGPTGTPAAWRTPTQCSAGCVRRTDSSASASSSMCSTRAALVAKRSSAGRSGSPSASHRRANSAVVADRDGERAVGRLEGLVRGDARVAVAPPAGRAPAEHAGGRLVEQRGQRGVHERHLDVLAAARALALVQRGLDAGRRAQPAHEVHERRADLQRAAVRGSPVTLISPPMRLQQEVVAGEPAGPARRTRRPSPSTSTRPGLRSRSVSPSSAQPVHQAGAEVLDQHVGPLRRAARQLAAASSLARSSATERLLRFSPR